MPRERRKTRTGEDAQNIKSVPGQRYGEGVKQQAMQRAMPAPDNTNQVQVPSAPTPEMAVDPATATDPVAQAAPLTKQDLAAMMGNPNLLGQPSARPNEPITTGLSSGAGPGREVLMTGQGESPIGRYLSQLSAETGNPKWARMRERAGL